MHFEEEEDTISIDQPIKFTIPAQGRPPTGIPVVTELRASVGGGALGDKEAAYSTSSL